MALDLTDHELAPDAARKQPSLALCRAALVAAGAFWSLGGVFIKAFSGGVPGLPHVSATEIVFYRSLFAALALAPFLGRFRMRAAGPVGGWRAVAVAVALYSALLGLYVASTQGTSAANAIFLQYTAPLYVIALSPILLGERWQLPDLATIAIATAGIGILAGGGITGAGRNAVYLGAASGLFFGLFLLWMRRLRHADPLAITGWNNLGVTLVFAVGLLFFHPTGGQLLHRIAAGDRAAATTLALLAAMGVLQIAVPYVLFSFGLRRVRSVEASLLTLVEPVLNPVWVALVIGEIPSPTTLAGGSLILLALALRYSVFGRRSSRTE